MNKTAGLSAFQRERARKKYRKAAGPILDEAVRLHQAGSAREAQALCLQVLENLPDHFVALHLLGVSKLETKELEEAEAFLQRALEIDSRSADALCDLGLVQLELRQYARARSSLERAIALRPNAPVALNNLGNALFHLKLLEPAIQNYDRAIALQPDYVDAIYNRGNALVSAGRFDEALQAFEHVIRLRPLYAPAYNGRALVYNAVHRFEEALASTNEALRLKPDFAQALSNRGSALIELGHPSTVALAHYQKALALDPNLERALLGQARQLAVLGRVSDALDSCRKAVSNAPQSHEALTILGHCLAAQGDTEEAIETFDQALAIQPDHEEAITMKIFALDFDRCSGFPEHQQARKEWWHQIGSKVAKFPESKRNNVLDPDRKLVIGYVSADFKNHSAAMAFGPVLRNHDKERVEIVCYSGTSVRDKFTDEYQRIADKWVEARRLPDDQLAEQIASDRIDILVDLSGFTAGHRLRVFASKPAPIQVTAWGHATGTGMPEIDYLFSDPVLTPAEVRHLFAEKVYDLPCMIAIDPPPTSVKPALQPPCLANGYVTFGVFNRVEKISGDAVRVWSQILQALPQSKLLIKHNVLDDPRIRQLLADRFSAQGLQPERIEFLGSTLRDVHIAAYNRVDICLDPFPQNGGVSTWEALHVGVPVLAKLGNSNASRAAGAILHSIGLDEWIADSEAEYIELALKYASQPEYLSALRSELPARIMASEAGNMQLYTRAVEAAYRTIWKEYCASRAADAPGSSVSVA
jgi:predicted O-linked N-acetylglucosamine transferase (SPINDLY family)